MIVRKPYAFLIKNFRIIHAILFFLLLFVCVKTYDIYDFFSSYASTGAFSRMENLTSQYIDYLTFGTILVSGLITVLIASILKMKNKGVNSYIGILLDEIVSFLFFIFMFLQFRELEMTNMNVETVKNMQDISLIALVVQVVFVFIVLSRALGFNIKQFDFKRDLEELDIDESDNEEVELIIGNNNYKYARFARKTLRLTKYFILENKMFVIGSVSLVALVISFVVFTKISVYNVTYSQGQQLTANSLLYTVNKSYQTKTNMKSQIITKDKTYVLVEVHLKNNLSKEYILTRETFRLVVDNEMIFPTFTQGKNFIDLGEPYSTLTVKSGEEKDFIVIFEIDEESKKEDYIFRIKNYTRKNITEIESPYKDIIIRPKNLDNDKNVETLNLSADIHFDKTILEDTSLYISKYQIEEKFKEDYIYCVEDNCKEGVYVVTPQMSDKGDLLLLKLDTTIKVDEDAKINKYIKTPSDLLEYYGILKYTTYGNVNTISINTVDIKYNENKYAYIEVPFEIVNASKIELIFNVRGLKYTVNLINK